MQKITPQKTRASFKKVETDILRDATYNSPKNLTIVIKSLYEICSKYDGGHQHTTLISTILYNILNTINVHLMHTWHTFVDQPLFDEMTKLCLLDIFISHYDFQYVRRIISNIFREILSASHISYDDAYRIYDKIVSIYEHNYDPVSLQYGNSKIMRTNDRYNDEFIFLKLFKNKTLPLSEKNSLKILPYTNIIWTFSPFIEEYLTFTYKVLYEILRKHDINKYCEQQICNIRISTREYIDALISYAPRLLQAYIKNRTNADTREFMNALVKHGNIDALHTYMHNNSLQYTVDDLGSACRALHEKIVVEIVNSKVLPNDRCIKCISTVLHREECYHTSRLEIARNIIAIFIQCGYPIPANMLRRSLQITRNTSDTDMYAAFKYGINNIKMRYTDGEYYDGEYTDGEYTDGEYYDDHNYDSASASSSQDSCIDSD